MTATVVKKSIEKRPREGWSEAFSQMSKNQQPRPKGTRYVVLTRYCIRGLIFFNRHESRMRKHAEGIKPLSTNKDDVLLLDDNIDSDDFEWVW